MIDISRDYPSEIANARKSLWAKFKDLRFKHGAHNVKRLFSAAILVKGTVYKDLFPDWHTVLSHSRVLNVNERIIKSLNEHTDWKTDLINHPLFANKTDELLRFENEIFESCNTSMYDHVLLTGDAHAHIGLLQGLSETDDFYHVILIFITT
jgi:hypothetical protein